MIKTDYQASDLNPYADCQKIVYFDEDPKITINGAEYPLSKDTKRINLDQIGVSPLNFEELKTVDYIAKDSIFFSKEDKDCITCSILIPGASVIDTREGIGNPDVEQYLANRPFYIEDHGTRFVVYNPLGCVETVDILLDKENLYVTMECCRKNFESSFVINKKVAANYPQKNGQVNLGALSEDQLLDLFILSPIVISPVEPHRNFLHTIVDSKSRVIDESRISASVAFGVLTIQFPFVPTPIKDLVQISPKLIHNEVLTTSSVTPVSNETAPSVVYAATAYNVGPENTLGVCCEPSWDKAPIEFKHNGTDWSGGVPVGKDWKFVILQNGHVIKWENGQNRKCDGKVNSFSINPNELHFG